MEDDRLNKALAHANYKTTIVQQRENLKVRLANALLYANNGGIFTVNPTLISMVDVLIRQGHEEAIIIDDKTAPIKLNLKSFFEDILSVYAEATNEFHVNFEKLRKARSVEAAVNA